jgi:hypothetical protein
MDELIQTLEKSLEEGKRIGEQNNNKKRQIT